MALLDRIRRRRWSPVHIFSSLLTPQFDVMMDATSAGKRQSEAPVGVSPQRKTNRTQTNKKIEGMPAWAEQMMEQLKKHTSTEISCLRVEVDEAKANAMEAQ